jgi:CO/xanthine dehydrogenase Mo-binding subunit
MTDQTGLSRRTFLAAGGAMLVPFGLPAGPSQAQIRTGNFVPYIIGPTALNTELDSWLAIHPNNTATLYFGRAEFGQGTLTGMLQIAAEELDLEMTQVSAANLDTTVTWNQGNQVSSSSIEGAAPSLRAAAAEARQALLKMAAARLNVPEDGLRVSAGVVTVAARPGASVTYGELIGDKRFSLKVTGTAPEKPASSYRVVGARVPRIDIPAKMRGSYEYIQHVRVPGMLHGRVVRPAGQGALAAGLKIKSIDESSISQIPGVQIVRKDRFIGVVAADEWSAVKAASQLKVEWERPQALSGTDRLHERLRASKTADKNMVDVGDVDAAVTKAAHTVSASFKSPYESHAPFAPNCAVADVRADSADVYCSTQRLFSLRGALARVLKLQPEQVRVRYVESSGTFGHSGYDDVAEAAAILSQAVGKPVRLQFSRGDELGWDNYGPAHLAEVRAAADANGKVVGFEYHGWQHGWNFVVEPTEELALDAKIGVPILPDAAQVNKATAGGVYSIPNRRVVSHGVNGLEGYLKGSFLRSPLDLSISFASEQVIDELAYRAKLDPAEFRRRNVSDQRWIGVMDAVLTASKWRPRVAGDQKNGDVVTGMGIALGTHFVSYGAAIAEIEVNRKTGQIRVLQIYGALDPGLVVNPISVEQQIEGQLIQATSRILHEEVRFDETSVTSLDWASYPILRFEETPAVTPIVVSRPDQVSTGAGEEVLAAAGAAIANAFFDATGVRMRERPFRPDRVLAALRAG